MKLTIVNAFVNDIFTGNPAAIALVDEFLNDETMQAIATEMNLSETAFVKPVSGSRFHIRWFSPSCEVKLCGHATLAAAHVLKAEQKVSDSEIFFDSLGGELSVKDKGQYLSLNFPIESVHPIQIERNTVKALGTAQAIAAYKGEHDDSYIILEYQNEDDVLALKPDIEALKNCGNNAIITTAPCKKSDYDFCLRLFAPHYGINEDPVTGSAQTLLAPFWESKLNKKNFKVWQASERGGELFLSLEKDRVNISGRAAIVETKTLLTPQ